MELVSKAINPGCGGAAARSTGRGEVTTCGVFIIIILTNKVTISAVEAHDPLPSTIRGMYSR